MHICINLAKVTNELNIIKSTLIYQVLKILRNNVVVKNMY